MTAPKLQFLADDTRVINGERTLVDRIRTRLDLGIEDVDTAFAVANLLALALVRMGDLNGSVLLCRREIEAGLANVRRGVDRSLLHALEAQVNLFRIEVLRDDVDEALAGLSLLERVADGAHVALPEMDWRDISPGTEESLKARFYARNVLVIDTCRVLLAADRRDALVERASHFGSRWPRSVLGHLHCVAEVGPILGRNDVAPPAACGDLIGSPEPARLALINNLHRRRCDAVEGRTIAPNLVADLDARIAADPGPFQSDGSPRRWRMHLAETVALGGDHDDGRARALDLASEARVADDPGVHRQACALLAAIGGEPLTVARDGCDSLHAYALDLVERIMTVLIRLTSGGAP